MNRAGSPEADLAAYLSAVRFRLVHTDTPLTSGVLHLRGLAARLGTNLELWITRLPDWGRARRRLAPLLAMPRMSTFAIAAIINRAVAQLPEGQAFVNVGVWHGFSLLAGMAGHADRRCVGIDNFSEFGGPKQEFLARFDRARGPRHEFHEMDYRDYFARVHQGPIGLYIYDGDHAYEHQLTGLEVAEPFLAPGSIILVDDTNEADPARATRDFMAARPGRYELLFDRHTACNGHPTLWNGLMVLRQRA
jgi:predicted O-methyltransferase YrrM